MDGLGRSEVSSPSGLRVSRLANRSSADPIKQRPRVDCGQKQALGEGLGSRGIDSLKPVTEATSLCHCASRYSPLMGSQEQYKSSGLDFLDRNFGKKVHSLQPSQSTVHCNGHGKANYKKTSVRPQDTSTGLLPAIGISPRRALTSACCTGGTAAYPLTNVLHSGMW